MTSLALFSVIGFPEGFFDHRLFPFLTLDSHFTPKNKAKFHFNEKCLLEVILISFEISFRELHRLL